MEPESPRISRIDTQQHDPQRVSIFVDGEFALGVHIDLLAREGLHVGAVLHESDVARLTALDEFYRARTLAMSFVAFQARSCHEVRQRLRKADFQEEVIDQVVERLLENRYLDDAAYSLTYARDRFRVRDYGPRRIRSDLMRKGIDSQLIAAAIEELSDSEMDETVERLAMKRWQALSREEDLYRRKSKTFDFLLRRGYSYDQVREAVERVARDSVS
ncbi:RecX family transcriptional regulator [soil metagenome]